MGKGGKGGKKGDYSMDSGKKEGKGGKGGKKDSNDYEYGNGNDSGKGGKEDTLMTTTNTERRKAKVERAERKEAMIMNMVMTMMTPERA